MGDAAGYTLGIRARKVTLFLVYGLFGYIGNSSYLLTMGKTLQGVFYDTMVCLPSAVLYSCLLCAPFAAAVRQLSDSIALCFANFLLISACLVIVMASLAANGQNESSHRYAFDDDLNFMKVFGAATNIVYSYTGQWLYFEIMAEMEKPDDFPKVFFVNAPLQVGMYLLVACWGYYYSGDQSDGYFLDNLTAGTAKRWASLLLLAHVGIAFIIKNVVLARYAHACLSPSRSQIRTRDEGGLRAHAEFGACSLLLIAGGYLIANSIPFFDDLLGIIGGLLSGPISFLLPMALLAGACKAAPAEFLGNHEAREVQSKRYTTIFDLVSCLLIGVFILLTMFVGTSQVILSIVQRSKSLGPPFSCHVLDTVR